MPNKGNDQITIPRELFRELKEKAKQKLEEENRLPKVEKKHVNDSTNVSEQNQ